MIRHFFILIFVFSHTLFASSDNAETGRLLVHLLSYIAADYPGAVKGGKVVSQSEYLEQKEFANTALETAKKLEVSAAPEIRTKLETLNQIVANYGEENSVAKLCREIEALVVQSSKLEVAPVHWPDRQHGKQLYQKNCSQCHGASGYGDGPSSGELNPKPTNFFDSKLEDISPFQAFNTIRLGVNGTSMAAFPQFSNSDVWDLAFYVISLRHEATVTAGGALSSRAHGIALKDVATHSDVSLRIALQDLSSVEQNSVIATIRLQSPVTQGVEQYISLALSKLKESAFAFSKQDFAASKARAIEAYLEGVEPIEPRLRARDYQQMLSLEQKMAEVRSAIELKVSNTELNQRVLAANEELLRSGELLKAKEQSKWLTFSISSGLFLREAFEAVLILITLLGVIRSIGSTRAAFAVHIGWISALGIGALLWFFSGWVVSMSGASRELLEASISALAVLVLLYFGFWLHRKTEIGKWRAFIGDMVKSAVEKKSLFVLGSISFMAVFREAFETVLFLRAVLLETGTGHEWVMLGAVVSSLLLVIVLSWVTLRFSVRIPIRQLFQISSFVMILLALVLVGKSVHAFQEAGWASITPISFGVRSDLFGLYPTFETMIPQLVLVLIALTFWWAGRRMDGSLNMPANPLK